ncbi:MULTISPECIES: hypothetical protein [Nostocales]|uniref:Uncharacterized protein n=3 Tax=Nostocales TaxID=1161 RepID=A0A0C1QM29_9CYAN|nr:hypothetical protein [Tolypothrix bouteillei]
MKTQKVWFITGASALHGHQPGDPKKFASVMIQLANTEHPPVHLPVGQDTIAMYRSNAAKMAREIEA